MVLVAVVLLKRLLMLVQQELLTKVMQVEMVQILAYLHILQVVEVEQVLLEANLMVVMVFKSLH